MAHPLTDYFLEMEPYEFEEFVADLWDYRGYETTVTPKSGDGGKDVIATKDEATNTIKEVIQVKQYGKGKKVQRPVVQQCAGIKQSSSDIDLFIIISASEFTNGAKKEADESNIKLIDGDELGGLIEAERAYQVLENHIDLPDELRQTEIEDVARPDDSSTKLDELEREMEKRGLVTSSGISSLEELRTELRDTYGFGTEEVSNITDALRYVYIGQESSNNIGVPHHEGDARFGREIDVLKQLNLVYEHHYSGKHDYGYDCTDRGNIVGSEVSREFLQRHSREIERAIADFGRELCGVFLNFGFAKTDEGHLSTRRGGGLSWAETMPQPGDFWDVIVTEYKRFKERLVEIGIAANVGKQVILPPEFDHRVNKLVHLDATSTIECHLALKNYVEEEIESRDEIIRSLDHATEGELRKTVSEYGDAGLTTEYTDGDPPFLVKDKEGIVATMNETLRTLLADL